MHLWSLSGKSLDSYPLKVEQRKYDWSIELVDFSADNKYIVAGISTDEYGFSGYLQLFDIKGNRIGKAFGRGWQFALSPDGKYIAAQDNNNTIQLWDMKGNLVGSHFRGHEASIISLAFSPDGYFIASGSKDGTVRLWDTKGNLISTFLGQGLIQSVMFSSDGQYIASSSYDGTIKLWPANWKSALKLACNRLKYHPVLTAPQTEEEKSAARVCFLK
jgi:WD40 repeat protein